MRNIRFLVALVPAALLLGGGGTAPAQTAETPPPTASAQTAETPPPTASAQTTETPPPTASAQTTEEPPSTALAEALFQQARTLFKAANYHEACPKFAESQRLEPKLGTLLNLAVCHEREGKVATAWAEYTSAAEIAGREGQIDRETFAHQQEQALSAKLAKIRISFSSPAADQTVELDGKMLRGAVVGVALPLDPGMHRIVVRAPGRLPWATDVKVPTEPVELPVAIPALEKAPAGASTTGPVGSVRPYEPPKDTRWLFWGGIGLGAAGLLVGSVAGGLTIAQSTTLKEACPENTCADAERGDYEQANTLANVSNAGFAVMGVGAGAAVIAAVLGSPLSTNSPSPKKEKGAAIEPMLGPGFLGVRGNF